MITVPGDLKGSLRQSNKRNPMRIFTLILVVSCHDDSGFEVPLPEDYPQAFFQQFSLGLFSPKASQRFKMLFI